MSRSDNSSRGSRGYPRRPAGFRVNWVRPRNKADRAAARAALRRGEEPEPARHRHGALWEAG